MGNCFGSEEAELVEVEKAPGHQLGHGQTQGNSFPVFISIWCLFLAQALKSDPQSSSQPFA
jgi:hypothetical protein